MCGRRGARGSRERLPACTRAARQSLRFASVGPPSADLSTKGTRRSKNNGARRDEASGKEVMLHAAQARRPEARRPEARRTLGPRQEDSERLTADSRWPLAGPLAGPLGVTLSPHPRPPAKSTPPSACFKGGPSWSPFQGFGG